MTKTARERMRDAYTARSPEKPAVEESPEMERIRAALKPSERLNVAYARIRREQRD